MSDVTLEALVASNPGQATEAEYALVHRAVRDRAPCRMLVFGVGRDTPFWIGANRDGRTAFLEDRTVWVDRVGREVEQAEVHAVRYRSVRVLWPVQRRFERSLLLRGLPESVTTCTWDVVLVDGPRGSRWHHPGRASSIYTARRLASVGTDVFVHDCHRTVERESCRRFFSTATLVEQVGSMRHYRVG